MGLSETDDGLEKQEGITLPLRRHCGDEETIVGATPLW